jgi:hypothetical protein
VFEDLLRMREKRKEGRERITQFRSFWEEVFLYHGGRNLDLPDLEERSRLTLLFEHN